MPRQFKTARKMCKLKLLDAAKELGVSQPTLSSWESGRKSPTIDSLLRMAELYNVSTDFLLGKSREESIKPEKEVVVPRSNYRFMHGQPVWSDEYGWMIIDSINECFVAPNGVVLSFTDDIQVCYKAEPFAEGTVPKTNALSLSELGEYDKIWVEPISADANLRRELCGWYTVMSDWVENSAGNRFLFDAYQAKWLAFSKI